MSNLSINIEGLEIANAYVEHGDVKKTAEALNIPEHAVVTHLQKKEVRDYLNGIYLDLGYRNRGTLGKLLDKMIESKLEEAEESGIYTSKDLFELLQFAHKMRMDEIKAEKDNESSTTVNVANFGSGNYGQLMDRLLNGKKEEK